MTEAFSKHGEVLDIHVPRKNNKAKLGFAFVQMSNKAEAGMALKALNGTQLAGRAVAIDWALPKDKFESKQDAVEKKKVEEEMDVDADSDEDGDDDDDDQSEESHDTDDDKAMSSDDENDDDESDEDDSDEDEDEEGEKEESKPIPERPSDVGEGRTMFIRNLPFTCEEEDVVELFSQFGAVNYAKLVIDRASGVPKGSCFLQFNSKDGADSCIKGSESNSGLSMGGRDLYVTMAVTRQQAGDMGKDKDKKKEQKDTRNLYLAREGMIRPGTEAAKDVSQADLTKRATIDGNKRRKLKDQNVFVSSVRLCVHNLPTTVTDKQLRTVGIKAAGDKYAKVTECRIMRDLDRVTATDKTGKSRGFGFISFGEHSHALEALRHLNNNPQVFGEGKRPIVEFSLENRKALEAKEKRLDKSKARLTVIARQNGVSVDPGKKRKYREVPKFKSRDAKPLATRKQQDVVARSMHEGKPLGLPKHSGPKERHKPRPNAFQDTKKKSKPYNPGGQPNKGSLFAKQPQSFQRNDQRNGQRNDQRNDRGSKAPMMKPGKRKADTDSFDKLVASYKAKIMKSVKL